MNKIIHCVDCGISVKYKTQKPLRCKQHAKEAVSRSHQRYQERNIEQTRKYRRDSAARRRVNHPEHWLLMKAKERARRKDIEFDIEDSDVIIPTHCPILGIELKPNVGGKRPTDNSPTLDRIDNTKGYVKGNVQVVSYRANTIKGDSSLEELLKVTTWLSAHKSVST